MLSSYMNAGVANNVSLKSHGRAKEILKFRGHIGCGYSIKEHIYKNLCGYCNGVHC